VKLVLAPSHNTEGKKDASGAFQPEAEAFAALHGAPAPLLFDNRAPSAQRLRQVLRFLAERERGSVDTLAIFSHGYKSGLQIGVSTLNCAEFALALAVACTREPIIVLYTCDTARDNDNDRKDDTQKGPGGDGGFADKLRDELNQRRGCRATIFAHASQAHTTWNPYVRRFDPGEMGGGHWVVEPGDDLWPRWVYAMRHTTLRLRFPFMQGLEIERELLSLNV
jgi:hypothetical protein